MVSWRHVLTAACLALMAAACSAPNGAGTTGPAPAATGPEAVDPSPAVLPATPAGIELGCAVAGDCAVKNVGNCCGYFPACVNKDSEVDPDAVRAECARTGTSSVCGWPDIQACDCVDGQCRAVTGPIPVEQ